MRQPITAARIGTARRKNAYREDDKEDQGNVTQHQADRSKIEREKSNVIDYGVAPFKSMKTPQRGDEGSRDNDALT